MLSNTFEASLQQVNPKLTLPYWDFTIESSSSGATSNSKTDQSSKKSCNKTPLLQPSWFGTSDPEDFMVGVCVCCFVCMLGGGVHARSGEYTVV